MKKNQRIGQFNCAYPNGHAHVTGNGDERDAQIAA